MRCEISCWFGGETFARWGHAIRKPQTARGVDTWTSIIDPAALNYRTTSATCRLFSLRSVAEYPKIASQFIVIQHRARLSPASQRVPALISPRRGDP